MTREERLEIYRKLSAPFPPEAIERTDGRQTGRGYSTTGIKYQYVVNRLNETFGVGCFRSHRETTVKEITTNSGRTAYEASCDLVLELGEWVDGKFVVVAEAVADGGHTAMAEADARKGSYTNAFKKAAAFFGCGRQAYEGTIDDDHIPAEAPAEQPEEQEKPQYVRTGRIPPQPVGRKPAGRNRITSRQLSAIWAIARKLGHAQGDLRTRVKAAYGVQPEFLSREQASDLIGKLNEAVDKASANGHALNGEAQQEAS